MSDPIPRLDTALHADTDSNTSWVQLGALRSVLSSEPSPPFPTRLPLRRTGLTPETFSQAVRSALSGASWRNF